MSTVISQELKNDEDIKKAEEIKNIANQFFQGY